MAVKRRGEGWVADWYTEHGDRKRRTFKLKSEAEAHEARMRSRARDIRDGDAPPPAGDPDMTLETFVTEIFNPRRIAQGIAEGTREREGATLEHHILPAMGKMRIRGIHRPTIREWALGMLVKESRRGGPLTDGSVRVAVATLSGVFAEAVIEWLIPTNPVSGIWRELRRGRAAAKRASGKRLVKALTTEQAQTFLPVAEKTEAGSWPALALMTLAGLRAGEALALTQERLDLRGGRLLVDQQLTQYGGLVPPKGGEAGWVQLAPQLLEICQALLRSRSAGRVVTLEGAVLGARAPGPFLLAPELPERPTGSQAQKLYRQTLQAMRRALKRAGLPSHFGLHNLRHTYGSGLVSRGVSLAFVQQQMRHRSIKTTVDDYGSWLPVEQPGALERFATVFLGGHGHLVDTLEGGQTAKSHKIKRLQE
jgi:integrase